MLSADYFVENIDEATEANREAKRLCNDVLSVARGMIQKLQNDIKVKDARIEELKTEVAKLRAEMLGNCEILQDTSGNITFKCSSGSGEDRWIPCSEGMPLLDENVLIKIVDRLNASRHFVPRTGYLRDTDDPTTCAWFVWAEPGVSNPLTDVFKVIAWHPLPEDNKHCEVLAELTDEVKFEVGDFVLCVSKAAVKINAVYLREDEEHYWILDKQCLTQQPLDKNHWKLTKYPGHMSVVEWLCSL